MDLSAMPSKLLNIWSYIYNIQVCQPPNAVIEIIFDEKLPGRCSC